ncbi:zinc finger, C2H2 type [Opisthorchis viverrini]|uniref:Zinc finger, C2H2 type n=1 Tax=Opisthorchis viverrini TaxID=6198 RepID=A0A1S8X6Y8_OPIVI|nr:zinc finger, C2H2 type [Opisthorchis viverrini]
MEAEQDEPMNLCLRDALSLNMSQLGSSDSTSSDTLEPLAALGRTMERAQSAAWSAYTNTINGLKSCSPEPMDAGLQTLPQFCSDRCFDPDTGANISKLHTSTPLRCSLTQVPFIHSYDRIQKRDNSHKTMSLNINRPERRRRVGWRGVAMCAACDLVFSRMDQLNKHYEETHSHLLAIECQVAEQTSTKVSKLLFQAQLDRLRSETEISEADEIKQSPDDQAELKMDEAQCDTGGHELCSSAYKSTSSMLSPTSSCITTSYSPESKTSLDAGPKHSPKNCHSPPSQADVSSSVRRRDGHGVKGYPCPRCNYTAKWPTELQKHVMVHATSRPFVCSVCSTSYKWSWDLGRHFSNAHPILPNPYKRLRPGRNVGKTSADSKKPQHQGCDQDPQ